MFTKKFHSVLILILALPVLTGTIAYFSMGNIYPQELGFPFNLKETKDSPSMWRATIVLNPQFYNRKNLDRLFLWYSKKHPDKTERLTVKVYTDFDKLRDLLHNDPYSAICWRQGDGFLADGGDNLWYSYIPDLGNPDHTKRVVLRGRDHSVEKEIAESWEISNANFKMSAMAYYLKDIEPAGVYYTFSSATRTPETQRRLVKDHYGEEEASKLKEFKDLQAIFTIRQDRLLPIPREQVRMINEQVSYAFMGWIYSVTTNGGRTWHQWDGETELPAWQCCDPNLIREVNIALDGTGIMTLRPDPAQPEKMLVLHTKDYGQHWKAE